MPNLANITIKKNDGTTDITYTGLVASGGDKMPAIWKSQTVGAAPAFRPTLSLRSEWNGPRTARRLYGVFSYPTTTTDAGGKTVIANSLILNVDAVVPQGMSDVDVNEAVSQGLNLVASTLIKDCVKSGYAAT